MKKSNFYLRFVPAMLGNLKRVTCLLAGIYFAMALHAFEYLGYTYTILHEDTKQVELTKGTAVDGCIVVPSVVYDGDVAYTVTSVGASAFESERNYTKVVIGDYVQNIGFKSFCHFGEGTTNNVIIFGKAVNYISTKAFPNFGKSGTGNKVMVLGNYDFANNISIKIFQNVKNTTFYLRDQATYDYFMSCRDRNWHQFDASESTVNNSYKLPFPVEMTITPGKWVTAIFPEELSPSAYESYFGKGTQWAQWTTGHCVTNGIVDGQVSGTFEYVYFFAGKTGTSIPANTPILLKAGSEECQYVSEVAYDEDKCQLCSDDLADYQKPEFGHKAYMLGATSDYTLKKGEFYLRSNADVKKLYFFKADNDHSFHVRKGKCWFRLTDDTGGEISNAKIGFSIDGETTDIGHLDMDEQTAPQGRIYSITGQYKGDDISRLSKGIYIVNGKKVIVK